MISCGPKAATVVDDQFFLASGMSSLTFRRRHRLSSSGAFRAVFDYKLRKSSGPLTIFVRPNGLEHPRLGLSIGRKVGNAVRRNALKRRVREAFRLQQHEFPAVDVVVTSRPHEGLSTPSYEAMLIEMMEAAERDLERRQRREGGG